MRRSAAPAAGAALALGTAVLSFLYARFTVDDAFITWRYGQTLVRHGTWNWNPTGEPVEAYTSTLYALLSVVPAALGMSAELFFKVLSAGILFVLTWWIWARTLRPAWQRFLMIAALVLNPTFHIHLWSGLETPLFVLLVVVVFGEITVRSRMTVPAVVAAGLLALTRPEGVAFALLAAVWAVGVERSKASLVRLGVLACAVAAYWITRSVYFHALIPNSAEVKSGSILDSLHWGRVEPLAIGALIIVALVGIAWALRSPFEGLRSPAGTASFTPLVLSAGVALVMWLVVRQSTLMMNYAVRFPWQLLIPAVMVVLCLELDRRTIAIAALSLMVVLGASGVTRYYGTGPRTAVVFVAAAVLLVLAWRLSSAVALVAASLVLSVAFTGIGADWLRLATYRPRLESSHAALARILAESAVTDRTIALRDAGIIPLVSDWDTLDLAGLASRRVATEGTSDELLREVSPAIVLVVTRGPVDDSVPESDAPRDWDRDQTRALLGFLEAPENGYTRGPALVWQPAYDVNVYYRTEEVDAGTIGRIDQAARDSRLRNEPADREYLRTHPTYFAPMH